MLANDRLKFRAWCHSSRTMLEWSEVKEHFYTLGWDEIMFDLTLMQFTTTYDANGTPIYEGDIITDMTDPDDGHWVVVWSPISMAFMFGRLQHDPRDDNYFKFEHPEDYLQDNVSPTDVVVGNIFENEELLYVNLE